MAKTVLDLYCEFANWQGGTIQQVRDDFKDSTCQEMDDFCSILVGNLYNIKDIDNVCFFTNHRLIARGF